VPLSVKIIEDIITCLEHVASGKTASVGYDS